MTGQQQWLVFAYTVPSEPSRKRAYIWRQLKQLGAVNLHQAFWLLPKTSELEQGLRRLGEKVTEFDGESTLLLVEQHDEDWKERVVAQFNAARNEEYAEVIENVERLEFEIARESKAKKFTFAELEDVEADMEKIGRWKARVEQRDYFNASLAADAGMRIKQAQALLEEFAVKVYEHEKVDAPSTRDVKSRATILGLTSLKKL